LAIPDLRRHDAGCGFKTRFSELIGIENVHTPLIRVKQVGVPDPPMTIVPPVQIMRKLSNLTVSVLVIMPAQASLIANVLRQKEAVLESAPEERPLIGRGKLAKTVDRCCEGGCITCTS
jgi:hypothetical protein